MPKSFSLIATLLLMVISALGGYYYAVKFQSPTMQQAAIINNNPPLQKTIYSHQLATIQGNITQVKDNQITAVATVKQTNLTDTFPLSKNFIVYVANPANGQGSQSADINSILLNKDASINLELIDGTYQVTSIFYGPNAPVSYPSPSASTK